jgi:hypothetical protein
VDLLDASPVGSNIIITFASPEMWWRVYSHWLLLLLIMFVLGLARNKLLAHVNKLGELKSVLTTSNGLRISDQDDVLSI